MSHHEPVSDFIWLSSKGGNEFVSCSTDGWLIWWDYWNLAVPTDSLTVYDVNTSDWISHYIGATKLEYVADYGVNLKAKIFNRYWKRSNNVSY